MKLQRKGYGRLEVNGEILESWTGEERGFDILQSAIRALMQYSLPEDSLSTFTIKFSRRPIVDEKMDSFDQMIQGHLARQAPNIDNEPLPNHPDITYGEYLECMEDTVFKDAVILKASRDRSHLTGEEIEGIIHRFIDKYSQTKYYACVGDLK